MKKRILIIGSLPPPYIGPSIAMQNLICAQIICRDFEINFLDISDRRDPKYIGKLDMVNMLLGIIHIIKYIWALLIKNPKLIYLGISQGIWGYLRDMGFLVPAILLKKKIVIHIRGSEFRIFYNKMPIPLRIITNALFKRVSRIIVLGESLIPVVEGLIKREKITVVPNGINFKKFDIIELQDKDDKKTGKNILYLSSLMERKGILKLIEATPIIFQKHPDAFLTITGEWQSQKDKEKALRFIKINRLNGRIRFTGVVKGIEKIKLYKNSNIFVFPPIEPEGMPWVILEAMSARLPVITTNQGAIPEVVEDGKSGFIIEPTAENIASKICMLLENPSIAKEMGENGRRRIEKYFNEEIYFKKMVEIFKNALETD